MSQASASLENSPLAASAASAHAAPSLASDARHAFVYAAGAVLLRGAGFLLLPIYLRVLDPADYGLLDLLEHFASIFSTVFLIGGLQQATLTFYKQAEGEAEAKRVMSTSLLLASLAVALCLATACALAVPLSGWLTRGQPALFVLAAVGLFPEALIRVGQVAHRARFESFRYVCVQVSQFAVRIGLTLLLVVQFDLGVTGAIVAMVATTLLHAAVVGGMELSQCGLAFDRGLARRMVAFSAPMVPTAFFFFLLHSGDRLFLARYGTTEELGLYAVGYKLATAVGMLARTPLNMVWSSRIYDIMRMPEPGRIIQVTLTRMLACYVAIGLAVCLFAREIIAVLGGGRYLGAELVVAPVTLAYLFLMAADMTDALLYVKGTPSRKLWTSATSAAVTCGLYWLLIPQYHALGAAVATLAGFFVHFLVTYFVTRTVFPVCYEGRRLCGLAGSALACWGLAALIAPGPWLIPLKCVLLAGWALGVWGLVLSPAERGLARAVVQRVRGTALPGRS